MAVPVVAGAALLLALVGFVIGRQSASKGSAREAEAAIDSLRRAARSAAVLLAPGARVALLSPTPSGPPDGRGRAVYDPATSSAVLVFDRVRREPAARAVLWALSDTGSRYLGKLDLDASGRAVLHLDDAGTPDAIDAFAVSLEPDSLPVPLAPPAPAGPVILMGILER